MFLTKGVGVDKNRLSSFEFALRDAGIERYNLVYVSSILPPLCKIITRVEGLKELLPGQILYCVMARNETDEPNRLICASIGVAMPKQQQAIRIPFGAPRLRANGRYRRGLCRRPRGNHARVDHGNSLRFQPSLGRAQGRLSRHGKHFSATHHCQSAREIKRPVDDRGRISGVYLIYLGGWLGVANDFIKGGSYLQCLKYVRETSRYFLTISN